MGVGTTITTEHMELLHTLHKKIPVAKGYTLPIFDCGFRTEGAAQFEDALNGYKNDGTPWDFSNPGQKESLLQLVDENARYALDVMLWPSAFTLTLKVQESQSMQEMWETANRPVSGQEA
jgi:hypothetical protein